MKHSSYLKVFEDFKFSPQESNVCLWVCEGLTHKEIGVRLGLSEHTVKGYMHKAKFRLFAKGHRITTKLEFISTMMKLAEKYEA